MKAAAAAAAIACSVAAAACTSTGVKVDQSRLAALKPGVTTYDRVIAMLGQPTGSSLSSNGARSITYSYARTQVNPVIFVPVVGMFAGMSAGGAHTETTLLKVDFDKNGVLTDYSQSRDADGVRTGLIDGRAQ